MVYTFIIIIHHSVGAVGRFELEHTVLVNKINVHLTGECSVIDKHQGHGLGVVDQILLEEHQSLAPLVTHRWLLNVDSGKVSIPRHLKCQILSSGLVCGHTLYCSLKDGIESLKKTYCKRL